MAAANGNLPRKRLVCESQGSKPNKLLSSHIHGRMEQPHWFLLSSYTTPDNLRFLSSIARPHLASSSTHFTSTDHVLEPPQAFSFSLLCFLFCRLESLLKLKAEGPARSLRLPLLPFYFHTLHLSFLDQLSITRPKPDTFSKLNQNDQEIIRSKAVGLDRRSQGMLAITPAQAKSHHSGTCASNHLPFSLAVSIPSSSRRAAPAQRTEH